MFGKGKAPVTAAGKKMKGRETALCVCMCVYVCVRISRSLIHFNLFSVSASRLAASILLQYCVLTG
jgi:hypothetical protein